MAALGLAVGALFPFFTDLLGVPPEHTRSASFRTACLGAGLMLAVLNWFLAKRIIGVRLRTLASRLQTVAATVGNPATWSRLERPASELGLPVASSDDLGATAEAFNALLEALDRERRFRSVVQATSDVIALIDPEGRIAFVSDSVTDSLGWDPNRLVGRAVRDLVHDEDVAAVQALEAPAEGTSHLFILRLPHVDGSWRTFEVGTSDHRHDPVIGALLLTGRDVTERFELQEQLKFRSEHDSLTGLPNRSSLLVRGAVLLARQQPGEAVAVVLMDLDRFKEINDTLGHGYGDRLLKLVGPRLRPLVRDVDMLARLGGDEFGVLLPRATLAGARAAAVRLREALTEPFELDDLCLDVEASVGVALSDGAGPHDIETLLRQADIAMYTAKELQSGVEVYNRAADNHDRSHLTLLSELRRGIADGQLVLHYQPKVSVWSGDVVGVEALVRWQHPTRGLLMPSDFLPAVEQTGLIEPMTTAVLDMAMTQIKVWSVIGIDLPVAVNLSARCLAQVDLPDRILAQLRSYDIAPQLLRLELTESALMAQPERARTIMTRLHAAGVGLSIDDFGTGYSSMAYLQQLPVDELKVDRRFVTHMASSDGDTVLVRSVIDLGHNLGLTVVAEGVEDEATREVLVGLRCDVAQGYLFARPCSAADMTEWLQATTCVGLKLQSAFGRNTFAK